MKKILVLLLALTLVFSLTACQSDSANGGNDGKTKNLEGSLEDILKEIYDKAETSSDFKEYIEKGLQTVEITEENCEYHLGKAGIEFAEGIASTPLMLATAYEMDIVRVKEGADIEKIKSEIKENVNPRKWICVGVEDENIIVDNIGDVIIVILSDTEGKALHDSFLSLK